MELLPEPVCEAAELIPQVVIHPGVAQLDDEGVLEPYPAKGRPIRPERRSQDECVATIVLRPGHGVAVAEAIELLGVERVHVDAALHKRFRESAARDLDRDAHTLGLAARQMDEPVDELRDRPSGVGHTPLCHAMIMFIEDPYLMRLRRPIDADEPAIRLVLCHRIPPFRHR